MSEAITPGISETLLKYRAMSNKVLVDIRGDIRGENAGVYALKSFRKC